MNWKSIIHPRWQLRENKNDGPPDPKLPFGKHKGKFASEVNVHYLDWMLSIDLREPFKTQLLTHLKTRPEWIAMGEENEQRELNG